MLDEEIKRRIASFPRWHYRFDLKGNPTPIWREENINRHEQRRRYFFEPLVQLFGGSLEGKRVLDLGCNAGFWSLNAARADCDYVLGVDGRQMHVDQANFVFEVEGVDKVRYDFVRGDLFEMDLHEFGRFDIVFCLGLMYHVSKHTELMEKISAVNDDALLIDTDLSSLPGSCLEIRRDQSDDPRSAVDRRMVMAPSWQAVHDLVGEFGYGVAALKPNFTDYTGARDFRRRRRAFICARETDVSLVPAETESEPPFVAYKPSKNAGDGRTEGGAAGANKLRRWMHQTDVALTELFASRRWKLASSLGAAQRRLLRKNGGPTAEARLLATSREFRSWSENREESAPGRKTGAKNPEG